MLKSSGKSRTKSLMKYYAAGELDFSPLREAQSPTKSGILPATREEKNLPHSIHSAQAFAAGNEK
jgi:hypothetical protein